MIVLFFVVLENLPIIEIGLLEIRSLPVELWKTKFGATTGSETLFDGFITETKSNDELVSVFPQSIAAESPLSTGLSGAVDV